MKSLMLLWKKLAHECASGCHTSATIDCKTVEGRCKHEGLSFLTITLPTFGKDFQKSLDLGYVDHNLFQGFSWKGGLPKFLWGFLDLVFHRTSGVLLDEPSIEAIRSIRQLTLMFGKILLPCSPEREKDAFASFVECEQDVRRSDSQLTEIDKFQFQEIASLLFSSTFSRVDRRVYYGDVLPKHGPGAVADRLTSNGKYLNRTWTERLERVFPSSEYLFPNLSFWEEAQDVDILEPGSELPVRVIQVPKTLKTPRIIAIEPSYMQYMQQGVYRVLLDELQKDDILRSLLGFDDQEPNQLMARKGASDGTLATLDLSEASDRVSNQHVRLLLSRHPHFGAAVDATRSRKADVPGHGVIRLAKFASMGSALCFPMEAMVFLTVVFIGIRKALNTHLTSHTIRSMKGRVRIFGDDIIVPKDCVESVIDSLETFGFRVNRDKSFWTGRFRESCGREYYGDNDVSIVKFRRMFPSDRRDVPEVVSLVAFRNLLYWRGYWDTCGWLDSKISEVLPYFPIVEESSSVLGRESVLPYKEERTDPHTHSPLVRGFVLRSRSPRDPLEGISALHKCLLRNEWRKMVNPGFNPQMDHLSPLVDDQHLERAGRPHAADIKQRWSPPF